MKMDKVEAGNSRCEHVPHRRRPIEPAQGSTREIGDVYPVQVDGTLHRHVAVVWSVDVGREDLHIVSASGETAAQGVNRSDRSAIPHGGQIGRDDVEEAQELVYRFNNLGRPRPSKSL